MKKLPAALGAMTILLLSAVSMVSAVAPGNNGTVKIEDSVNPKPEPANDPHVCAFDLKFYFADAGQHRRLAHSVVAANWQQDDGQDGNVRHHRCWL